MRLPGDTIKLDIRLTRPGKIVVLMISITMVAALGLLDYYTGFEVSFSIFYLIPISVSVLLAGSYAGLAVSVVSALSWLFADLAAEHVYTNPVIPAWNTFMRLGYFTIHTVLLSRLMKLYRETRGHSYTDPLTGVCNWRFFEEIITREKTRSLKTRKPFTIVYIDLDNFKAVNDRFGHSAGDRLLIDTCSAMSQQISTRDVIARLGGDEFALFLNEAGLEKAKEVVTSIIRSVTKSISEKNLPVTISMGVVIFYDTSPSCERMIKLADELMYKVKNSGKNNVEYMVYGEKVD